MSSIILNPFQLLELNIISAQDLALVSRSMRTYAVAWVHPDRKLSTRVDSHGRSNPTWNDKFVFRVDEEFLLSDTSGVMIEIYAGHWFKDVLVGRVRVLVAHLVTPPSRPFRHQHHVGMRFVALQVRRPSGRPQGILNIGVAVLDSSMRSMPLYKQLDTSAVGYRDLMGEQDPHHHHNHNNLLPSNHHQQPPQQQQQQGAPELKAKPELRRTKSDTSSIIGPGQVKTLKRKVSFRNRPHSVINGSGSGSEDGSTIQERRKKKKESNSRSSSLVNGSQVGGLGKHMTGSYTVPNPKLEPTPEDLGMAMIPFQPIMSPEKPFAKTMSLDFDAPPTKPGKPIITESELGPSPSEVAAAVAAKERYKVKDAESSVVDKWSMSESVEGLQSKLERWRMELPTVCDRGEYSSLPSSGVNNNNNNSSPRGAAGRHSRRHTDGGGGGGEGGGGGGGLFSCVSNICGLECTIVCGSNAPP
ncbi:protein bunched, class 2/F/G isoform [Rhodamnia argentea]|uniref:Protein bunched, class 2/F/G isoform n=1 Tax=Rhodamnia argentea TaxID=178133 RepID=A0A8B8QSC5_9MYRT|nr:protein bunched, class 2/F/G isoform [Rhodamnia argentea]